MIPLLEKLHKDAWRTSGARYNAARRLRRRESFATVSLALMSALTIAIAFIQRVYAMPQSSADNYLSVASVSLGIFLLTVSLVEWGAKTGSKAESLHQNAEKLNTFWRKVDLHIASTKNGVNPSLADMQTLNNEYDVIKSDCRYNHEPIDDTYFCIQHSKEFGEINQCIQLKKIIWHLMSAGYLIGLWLILTVALVFVVYI